MQTVHRAIGQLQRLSDLFSERRQQLARQAGLTEQQWRVLEEISTEHFIPSLFARSREQTPAAVSKVLRQLLDKQLVCVSVAHNDGRQRAYELSDRGREVMALLRRERNRAIDTIWKDLPERELSVFNQVSAQLIDRIEKYAQGTGQREED